MTLFPHKIRRAIPTYGSATLFISQRIGAGSTSFSSDVDITLDEIKSFQVRGNVRGSYFLQVTAVGTEQYRTLNEGTFPAGPGSIKTVSFTEAFRRARVGIRMSAAGSASAFYGGFTARSR